MNCFCAAGRNGIILNQLWDCSEVTVETVKRGRDLRTIAFESEKFDGEPSVACGGMKFTL